MKRIEIALLAILITGTTVARASEPACNVASYREAKIRCATSSKQSCISDVYIALEGGGVDAAMDSITCVGASLKELGDAVESERGGENTPPATQSSATQQVPSSQRTIKNSTSSPGAFQGVAPFGQPQSNPTTMQSPAFQYPGTLPPQVTEMMRQMQQTYAPRLAPISCQGVTTSALTGFDQSGNESSDSRLEKFDVVQIIKAQQNGGRTYFLSTTGFWYDAGYIKKSSGCNI